MKKVFVIAVMAMALSACGGEDKKTTAPTFEEAVKETPQCSEVWKPGNTLPEKYEGCMKGDNLELAISYECSSGSDFYPYGDFTLWAVNGKVHKGTMQEYEQAYEDCTAGGDATVDTQPAEDEPAEHDGSEHDGSNSDTDNPIGFVESVLGCMAVPDDTETDWSCGDVLITDWDGWFDYEEDIRQYMDGLVGEDGVAEAYIMLDESHSVSGPKYLLDKIEAAK